MLNARVRGAHGSEHAGDVLAIVGSGFVDFWPAAGSAASRPLAHGEGGSGGKEEGGEEEKRREHAEERGCSGDVRDSFCVVISLCLPQGKN